MYTRLVKAMKSKNITTTQINGTVERGFYFDEATKVKQVFFPEYDIEYLFEREKNAS